MLFQIMLSQMDRDEKIQHLVDSLDGLLHFILYAGALKDFKPSTSDPQDLTSIQIHSLQQILEQITDCAYFIIGYTKTKNSGKLYQSNLGVC